VPLNVFIRFDMHVLYKQFLFFVLRSCSGISNKEVMENWATHVFTNNIIFNWATHVFTNNVIFNWATHVLTKNVIWNTSFDLVNKERYLEHII